MYIDRDPETRSHQQPPIASAAAGTATTTQPRPKQPRSAGKTPTGDVAQATPPKPWRERVTDVSAFEEGLQDVREGKLTSLFQFVYAVGCKNIKDYPDLRDEVLALVAARSWRNRVKNPRLVEAALEQVKRKEITKWWHFVEAAGLNSQTVAEYPDLKQEVQQLLPRERITGVFAQDKQLPTLEERIKADPSYLNRYRQPSGSASLTRPSQPSTTPAATLQREPKITYTTPTWKPSPNLQPEPDEPPDSRPWHRRDPALARRVLPVLEQIRAGKSEITTIQAFCKATGLSDSKLYARYRDLLEELRELLGVGQQPEPPTAPCRTTPKVGRPAKSCPSEVAAPSPTPAPAHRLPWRDRVRDVDRVMAAFGMVERGYITSLKQFWDNCGISSNNAYTMYRDLVEEARVAIYGGEPSPPPTPQPWRKALSDDTRRKVLANLTRIRNGEVCPRNRSEAVKALGVSSSLVYRFPDLLQELAAAMEEGKRQKGKG